MGSISPLLVSSASPLTPIQNTHGVSSTGTDESYNVKEWEQYLSDCLHYCRYVCVCVCVHVSLIMYKRDSLLVVCVSVCIKEIFTLLHMCITIDFESIIIT